MEFRCKTNVQYIYISRLIEKRKPNEVVIRPTKRYTYFPFYKVWQCSREMMLHLQWQFLLWRIINWGKRIHFSVCIDVMYNQGPLALYKHMWKLADQALYLRFRRNEKREDIVTDLFCGWTGEVSPAHTHTWHVDL